MTDDQIIADLSDALRAALKRLEEIHECANERRPTRSEFVGCEWCECDETAHYATHETTHGSTCCDRHVVNCLTLFPDETLTPLPNVEDLRAMNAGIDVLARMPSQPPTRPRARSVT